MNEKQHYGTWTTDAAGLPCFVLALADGQAPDASFRHLIRTGGDLTLIGCWTHSRRGFHEALADQIGGVVCPADWTSLRSGKAITLAKGWTGTAAGDASMAGAT